MSEEEKEQLTNMKKKYDVCISQAYFCSHPLVEEIL